MTYKNHFRYDLLERILKLKKDNIQLYEEISHFILKFLDGKIQDPLLNNKIMANLLGISEIRASKVLSVLNANNLIIKNIEKNSYKLIPINNFKQILLDWIIDNHKEYTANYSELFREKVFPIVYKEFDLFQTVKHVNELFQNLDLNKNIYQESITIEFLARKKFDELSKDRQKLINNTITNELYKYYHQKCHILISRLEKIVDEDKKGRIYSIYCLKKTYDFILFNKLKGLLSKKVIKEIGLKILNSILQGIEILKEYILKNKFLFFIDFNTNQYNGVISILPPHVVQYYNLNSSNPIQVMPVYYYGERYSSKILNIYCNIFKSLLAPLKDQYKNYPEIVFRENIGRCLYNKAIKIVNEKISEISKL
ncbi:MAG: hypothetical protein ACTSPY_16570 [Candidatus Helarchaeota archaeon]